MQISRVENDVKSMDAAQQTYGEIDSNMSLTASYQDYDHNMRDNVSIFQRLH